MTSGIVVNFGFTLVSLRHKSGFETELEYFVILMEEILKKHLSLVKQSRVAYRKRRITKVNKQTPFLVDTKRLLKLASVAGVVS